MPSLQNLTAFALSHAQWGLLLYLLFSVFITWRICARWQREAREKRPGNKESAGARWLGYLLVFTLFSFLSMGALLMPLAIGERISVFATGTAYEGRVVSVDSRLERVTLEDSNKRSYTEEVMMHTPIYAFTLEGGHAVEVRGDIASGDEPGIGDTQRLFYNAASGGLVTASVVSVLMLSFGALFSVMLVVVFFATLRYAFQRSARGPLTFLGRFLLGAVLPLTLLLMTCGMGWYIYERLLTDRRNGDPYWVAFVAAFFCMSLVLAGIGFLSQRGKPEPAAPTRKRGRP